MTLATLGKKIPLVLVHGWQLAADVSKLKVDTLPGVCNWVSVIKDFYNQGLYDKYKLYTFSYDSYLSTYSNAKLLSDEMGKFENGIRGVVLAHSMGGIVAHTYLKKFENNKVKHLITLATPFRGTPVLLCSKSDGAQCTETRINSGIIDYLENKETYLEVKKVKLYLSYFDAIGGIDWLVGKTAGLYQGTRDLAWEYGGKEINRWKFFNSKILEFVDYSVDNPRMKAVNVNDKSQYQNYTAFYGVTDESDSEEFAKILSPAIKTVTNNDNDGIVPVGSSCLSTLAFFDNSCIESLIPEVKGRKNANHKKLGEQLGEFDDPNSVNIYLRSLALENSNTGFYNAPSMYFNKVYSVFYTNNDPLSSNNIECPSVGSNFPFTWSITPNDGIKVLVSRGSGTFIYFENPGKYLVQAKCKYNPNIIKQAQITVSDSKDAPFYCPGKITEDQSFPPPPNQLHVGETISSTAPGYSYEILPGCKLGFVYSSVAWALYDNQNDSPYPNSRVDRLGNITGDAPGTAMLFFNGVFIRYITVLK
jgi:triacylglycerol esterase/lipase EstA (alpha/beta hydrolase family)